MVPTLDPTQTQTLLGFRVQQANPRGYSFLCAQRREDEERRGAGAEPDSARRAKRRRARDRRARPSRGAREDGEQPLKTFSCSKRKVLSSGLDQLSRSDESQIPIRGRFRPLDRVDESKRAGVGFACSIVSRASESRWHFSGREPDSAPGSLSPARPHRKQTKTAGRLRSSRRPRGRNQHPSLRKADLPKEKRAFKKKSGPPRAGVGFARSIVSRASENRWHLSGREPDSARGSLSPACIESKREPAPRRASVVGKLGLPH